jgi:hypothetical protein
MTDTVSLVAVVETALYLRHSAGLLTDTERQAIVDHLAAHPTDGDLVSGGGGIRKLRWASPDGANGVAYESFIISPTGVTRCF